MSDISKIILVTAFCILIAGFIGFLEFCFPKIKKRFSNKKINYLWLYGITIGLFIFLTYPYFFNLWAKYFWNVPANAIDDYTKLGALGDIYGSLNTLISSIALCAVAYSTWIQVNSLKETRKANEKQLKLSKEMHDEQIKESQNSNFSNAFYALLNYKNDRLKSLVLIETKELGIQTKESIISGHNIFFKFGKEFYKLDKDYYTKQMENVTKKIIREDFIKVCQKYNSGESYFEIASYFEIYLSLIELVYSTKMDSSDQEFYLSIIRRSMTSYEQITLFFLAPMSSTIHKSLKNSYLFDAFQLKKVMQFVLRFYDESYFHQDVWKEFIEDEKQTPT